MNQRLHVLPEQNFHSHREHRVPWSFQQLLDCGQPGIRRLKAPQYKKLLREMQVISPLRVSTYGAGSHLSSRIRWQHVQVSCHRGLADAGGVEISFRFNLWEKVYVVSEAHLARPGIYVCDDKNQLMASICLDSDQQRWSFLAKLPAARGIPVQNPPLTHIAGPEVIHRRRASIRKGFGPHTHHDARAALIARRYAVARCEAMDPRSPTRCSRIPSAQLPELFAALHDRELQLSLVCGPPAFWQYHETTLRPEASSDGSSIRLRGKRCELELCQDSLSETWLVRAHHEGNFVYAILFYDNRLALDLAVILPECHIAASVANWRRLLKQVHATLQISPLA